MLKDKFNALINELENVDNKIKRLEDENLELQKLVDDGFNSFNTETHCLVERDKLGEIISQLDEISTYDIEENIAQARSYCEEAEYSINDVTTYRDDAVKHLERILKDTEVVEEAKKTPAKKTIK